MKIVVDRKKPKPEVSSTGEMNKINMGKIIDRKIYEVDNGDMYGYIEIAA